MAGSLREPTLLPRRTGRKANLAWENGRHGAQLTLIGKLVVARPGRVDVPKPGGRVCHKLSI